MLPQDSVRPTRSHTPVSMVSKLLNMPFVISRPSRLTVLELNLKVHVPLLNFSYLKLSRIPASCKLS